MFLIPLWSEMGVFWATFVSSIYVLWSGEEEFLNEKHHSLNKHWKSNHALFSGICVSRSPNLSLVPGPGSDPQARFFISRSRPSICIFRPRPSICVCLFFVLQLNFAIVTVSTYINHSIRNGKAFRLLWLCILSC